LTRMPDPRPATASDFDGFVSLFTKSEIMRVLGKAQGNDDWLQIGQSYVEHVLQTELASWDACCQRFSSEGNGLWVMTEHGKVIGSVGAIMHSQDHVELVRMYVDESCRRSGNGRKLVETLLDHARLHGASHVKLTTPQVNLGGINFYEAMGFKKITLFTASVHGRPLELVELCCWLCEDRGKSCGVVVPGHHGHCMD